MDNLWLKTLCTLDTDGIQLESRNGSSSEVVGYSEKLETVNNNFLFNRVRKLSPYYACAELLWYLAMTDDTTFLQLFAPGYARFTEDGVHAFGAYGDRWVTNVGGCVSCREHKVDQLTDLIATLSLHPESRQAVMTMWTGSDLEHAKLLDKKDLPCTLVHQFLLRNGYLHLVTTMRSNDVWLGMPYDVFCNTQLQKLVADILGVIPGSYTHNVGSMHFYERNFEQINKMMDMNKKELLVDSPISEHYPTSCSLILAEQIRMAITFVINASKSEAKVDKDDPLLNEMFSFYSIIADAALVCAAKWHPEIIDSEYISDPQLRKAVEVFDGKA